MKETILIWKAIFTTPAQGYLKITPRTRIGFALLILLVVSALSSLLLLPMLTSESYYGAYKRALGNYLEASSPASDPGARREQLAALDNPVIRNVMIVSAAAGEPLNLVIGLLASSLVVWLASLVVKNKLGFKLVFRILAFTWAVFVWQALLQNVIMLLSNQQAVFDKVNTLAAWQLAQRIPFDLSILLPPGSVGPVVLYTISFVTSIFNIIFYVLLYAGIRAVSEEKNPWKAGTVVLVLVLVNYLSALTPALFGQV